MKAKVLLERSDFDFVRELVRKRAAIVIEPGKEYLVENRLGAIVRRLNYRSVRELLSALRTTHSGALQREVVEAMTTNETSFFRDVFPFQALKTEVLPKLIAARERERQLHVWCAACSSGQEPYSVAMLLEEFFPALKTWEVKIWATDLHRTMVERTRVGKYSALEVSRGLAPEQRERFFIQHGGDFRAKDSLRNRIEAKELNLADAWPDFPAMDLVLLRNVLIYFDVEEKRRIIAKTRRIMRPHGFLFLGCAETTMKLSDAFDRVEMHKTAAYKPAAGRER